MKRNVLPLIYTSVVVAIGLVLIANKQSKVSGMTDTAPTLENLKRGISNGWYTAELTMINGQQAIRLSGKLTNGKQYSDVYPVTPEVAQELRKMGVK